MHFSRRLARLRLIRPIWRLANHVFDADDPWQSTIAQVPRDVYGPGHLQDFAWYLEGQSQVSVRTLDDMCAWLVECEYASDVQLFNVADFWQHPRTFESLRKGDCEDFSLWAWRKLRELGISAEFVSGRCLDADRSPSGGHAWVLLHLPDGPHILEGVARDRERMVRRLADVHREYEPHASVDHHLQGRLYSGYVRYLHRRRLRFPPRDA